MKEFRRDDERITAYVFPRYTQYIWEGRVPKEQLAVALGFFYDTIRKQEIPSQRRGEQRILVGGPEKLEVLSLSTSLDGTLLIYPKFQNATYLNMSTPWFDVVMSGPGERVGVQGPPLRGMPTTYQIPEQELEYGATIVTSTHLQLSKEIAEFIETTNPILHNLETQLEEWRQ